MGIKSMITVMYLPPHVLDDADYGHAVEPRGALDQRLSAFGQDGVVNRLPNEPEPFGDTSHREVLDHAGFQRPPQATSRQLRP